MRAVGTVRAAAVLLSPVLSLLLLFVGRCIPSLLATRFARSVGLLSLFTICIGRCLRRLPTRFAIAVGRSLGCLPVYLT